MQFQKYINHNTSRSLQPAQQQTFKNLSSMTPNSNINKPRVIKFVGNMQQNIKQILHGINCHCGNKKEFYNIMVVFANKIEKLRKQREHYKNTLKEYLMTMNSRNTNERVESTIKKDVQVQTVHLVSQKIRQPLSQIKSLSSRTNQNNLQNLNNNKKRSSNKKQNKMQQQQTAKYQSSSNLKKNYQNKQNQQDRNNFTAIKLSSQRIQNSQYATTPLKQIKSQDKRKRRFYQDDIAGDISNNRFQELQNLHSNRKDCNFIVKGSNNSSSNKKKISLLEENKNDNNNIILNELQEFSLNLSSFEDGEKGFSNHVGNQRQCSEFMKQVSGIMSETNLLESDQEDEIRQLNAKQQQQSRQSRKSSTKKSRQSQSFSLSRNKKSQSILDNITPNNKGISQLQQKINKLKMLKQSTNLIHFGQTIGTQFNESILSNKMKVYETQNTLDSNMFINKNTKKFESTNNFNQFLLDEQQITKKKSLTAVKSKISNESYKKNDERQKQKQNHLQKKSNQRTFEKAQSNHKQNKQNKQNQRKTQVESCLKHYNISLEKLQEFIQNKNCIKQLQRTQDFENNLRGFKTFTSCTLKQPSNYDKYDIAGGNNSNIFDYISFKEDGNNRNSKNKNSVRVLGQRNINY